MTRQLQLDPQAPWKARFRAAGIPWAVLANQNPTRGLVCTNRDGIYQLYAWDVTTGELRRLTDDPTGVVGGTLSSDGAFVYYLQDDGGNEIGHFVRVPWEGGAAEDLTPDLPPYGAFNVVQSFDGGCLGMRIADKSGQMLFVFAPGTAPRQLHKSTHMFTGPVLSHAGEIAVIATTEGTGSTDRRLVAFDANTGERIAELWDGEGVSHGIVEFAPLSGDFDLLCTTSVSGNPKPFIWNPRTGARRDLKVDDIRGEVVPMNWSPDGATLLLSQRYEAKQQLYLYHLPTDEVTKLEHSGGVISSSTFDAEGRILIAWQDGANPACLLALDGKTGQRLETVLEADDAPAGRPFTSITFESENGDTIQGWLAKPDGEGPFPTILHTHGGPTAVMQDVFFPECQAWLDHGFAFLTINYHGSTAFGKAFEKSIIKRLGELEAQDMASAYQWLVENGIAQPDAVFLTGGSYGGYLTLLGIGKRPELWAGGMAVVAIADWTTMYEDESEMLRGYQRALFGGSPEETPERHEKSSPITYAEDIQAPIFVIQGSNDTRCPARQMKVYEEKLKSLGKDIDVYWFEAGHGSRAQEQQIDQQERKLRFALDVMEGIEGKRAA